MKAEKKTKKWRKANWVRFSGVCIALLTGAFMNAMNPDSWRDSLIAVGLLILVFNLVFVIPDRLFFGKRLVKVKYQEKEK